MYKHVENGKQLEELIFKTLESIDTFKLNHEESASVFVKINEIQQMTEKMLIQIDEELEVTDQLHKSIKSNNDSIGKNIVSLEKRFEKLK